MANPRLLLLHVVVRLHVAVTRLHTAVTRLHTAVTLAGLLLLAAGRFLLAVGHVVLLHAAVALHRVAGLHLVLAAVLLHGVLREQRHRARQYAHGHQTENFLFHFASCL